MQEVTLSGSMVNVQMDLHRLAFESVGKENVALDLESAAALAKAGKGQGHGPISDKHGISQFCPSNAFLKVSQAAMASLVSHGGMLKSQAVPRRDDGLSLMMPLSRAGK